MEHTPLTSKTKTSSSIGNNEVEYFRNQIRGILPDNLWESYDANNTRIRELIERISNYFFEYRETHRHCLWGVDSIRKL